MEEIDAVALAEPVQTASALRMSSLLHEKLPKVSHDPSLTRTSSSTRANVLGPKVQCFLSILTLIFPLQLSFFRLLLAIKHRGESKEEKKRVKKEKKRKEKQYLFLPLYTRSIGSIAVHLGAWQTPTELQYFNRLLDILQPTSDLSMAGCKVWWMLGGKMVPRDPCASSDHVHARSLICCCIARTPILSEPIEKSVSVNCYFELRARFARRFEERIEKKCAWWNVGSVECVPFPQLRGCSMAAHSEQSSDAALCSQRQSGRFAGGEEGILFLAANTELPGAK